MGAVGGSRHGVRGAHGGWFGLRRRVERSSALDIGGDRSERLVNICRQPGRVQVRERRRRAGLSRCRALRAPRHPGVEWQQYVHPIYPQLHGEFVPYLSALDLLLNCGDEAPLIAFGGMH